MEFFIEFPGDVFRYFRSAGEEEEGEDLGDDQRQPVGGEGCQNAHGGAALRLCCLFLFEEAALEMRMYDSQWLRGGRACCCAPK